MIQPFSNGRGRLSSGSCQRKESGENYGGQGPRPEGSLSGRVLRVGVGCRATTLGKTSAGAGAGTDLACCGAGVLLFLPLLCWHRRGTGGRCGVEEGGSPREHSAERQRAPHRSTFILKTTEREFEEWVSTLQHLAMSLACSLSPSLLVCANDLGTQAIEHSLA